MPDVGLPDVGLFDVGLPDVGLFGVGLFGVGLFGVGLFGVGLFGGIAAVCADADNRLLFRRSARAAMPVTRLAKKLKNGLFPFLSWHIVVLAEFVFKFCVDEMTLLSVPLCFFAYRYRHERAK